VRVGAVREGALREGALPAEGLPAEGLRVEGLRVRTRAGATVAALSARIAPGEVLTVMGPSGSGKSTLLAALIGAPLPDMVVDGRIWLEGAEISALPVRARRIGILFQDDILFPHLSVAGNLAFALPPGGARAARAAAVEAALVRVGLGGLGTRDPATLSGGQRARVALMRTLLAAPRALLLDEPFARLDRDLRAQTRALVFGEARARGLPVVLVTHDPEDAAAAGGRIVSPRDGDGDGDGQGGGRADQIT
jgi:putative thiamine transport system ATP-binding protein